MWPLCTIWTFGGKNVGGHTIFQKLCDTCVRCEPSAVRMWVTTVYSTHSDDVIKWKHFPRHWPSVRGIHQGPVNSPHKGQWRGALMFSLICVWINGWVNKREAGDLRRYRAHYDFIVMIMYNLCLVMLWYGLGLVNCVSICYRVTSLALWPSQDCPGDMQGNGLDRWW